MKTVDRRTLIKQGAALALTAVPAADALAQAATKIEVSKTARIPAKAIVLRPIVTRPRVDLLALNDPVLESYRAAIKAMQALPASDPRNWTKQAQIHLNNCPHQNWFFLPWHRAYLVAFERICRELSGNSSFALPYWDWTSHPQIPAAFADPNHNGQPNPLFDAKRASQTVSIPANIAGPNAMSGILAEPTFEVFASSKSGVDPGHSNPWQKKGVEGPFESGPHDQVHVRVGGGPAGDMYTFMSPLDPIFWLHHCNIDRTWDTWNRNGNANTSDSSWLTMAFQNHFVNAAGTPYTVKVSEVLNISTLGYKYPQPLILPRFDIVLRPIFLPKIPPETAHVNPEVLRVNSAINLPITLKSQQVQTLKRIMSPQIRIAPQMAPIAPQMAPGAPQTKSLKQTPAAAKAAQPVTAPVRVVAFIRDVEPPKSGNVEVRVFVNYPNPTPQTPTSDPHYAGSFTFFGHAGHDGDTHSYMVDLTRALIRLGEAPTDKISVGLVAVPIEGVSSEGAEVKPGRIDIAIL